MSKKKIKKIIFKLLHINKLKNFILKIVELSFKYLKYLVPTDENMILFIAYFGRGYMCNPKYIHQEILKDSSLSNIKSIWVVKNTSLKIDGAILVKYKSLKYFYYLAKSKIWISNCKLPTYCSKKEKQIYIQTWHGSALKKLAHDINLGDNTTFYRSEMSKEDMVKSYDIDVKRYNYLISPNSYSTGIFKSAFKIEEDRIREYGYPRNDYLVNLTQDTIDNIKSKLNIDKDKKVILYAPTWRDKSFNSKGYIFELKCDFKKWKEILGKDYIVIFKPHYLISNKFDLQDLEGFVYNIEPNIDINELYAISDLLITDYSSVFFDFSILGRPILYYMYDLEEYSDEIRGLYLDVHKDLPGDIIRDEDTLLNTIKEGSYKTSEKLKRLDNFRKDFHSFEKGNASKKIIDDLIIPNINIK